MARKKTGTVVKTKSGLWQAVITLADGSRKRLTPFPKGTSEAMAREKAEAYSERAGAMKLVRPDSAQAEDGSAMGRWLDAWEADRLARGFTTTRENISHYRLHIAPVMGTLHVKDWTRASLRDLSNALDTKVQADEISWKSAQNIWCTATKLCADATESKVAALRVRDDNPAIGVRGPDRGDKRLREFLYPSEFLALVECNSVPLEWRRLVAIAANTYMRYGELRVLDWRDVDLAHGTIRVHQAFNRVTRGVKGTKGGSARPVPIELALRPLLQAMHAESGGVGRVLPNLPGPGKIASALRNQLLVAGVLRSGLHDSTETQRHLVFHDLRGTGITWMAIRGDDPLKIQQRAGHTDFKTTQGYIATAEAMREGFGSPFPALPDLSNRSPEASHQVGISGFYARNQIGGLVMSPSHLAGSKSGRELLGVSAAPRVWRRWIRKGRVASRRKRPTE